MAKIRLNFSRLSIPQKIARSQQIVAAITGNPDFPTPSPSLTSVTTVINALNGAFTAAQAARQTAKEMTSDQNAKEDSLDQLITQLTAYVESVAGDNEKKILSAGMDMRAPAISGTDAPEQPTSIRTTKANGAGA